MPPTQMRRLIDAIKAGKPVNDDQFDRIFPPALRRFSTVHWTPTDVAQHGVEMLVDRPGCRVLDVGSGSGKFCIIGALMGQGYFHGIEQRKYLVDVSKQAALRLNAVRASFTHGNALDADWSVFDAFYLFNPFYEHMAPSVKIDDDLILKEETYFHYIKAVQKRLFTAKVGTRVLTFYGFGGAMPQGYQMIKQALAHSSSLELWIKMASH